MADKEKIDEAGPNHPLAEEDKSAAPADAAPKEADGDLNDIPLDKRLSRQIKRPTLPFDKIKLNNKQLLWGTIGAVVVIVLLMVFTSQPRKGSLAFGICSTFLELNTPYPETLRFNGVEGSQTAVRIYFTNVDPFGEFRQETIECTFGHDTKTGMKMTRIQRNRRPVDKEIIEKFNILLPTIIASKPYLVLPPNWKNPLVVE